MPRLLLRLELWRRPSLLVVPAKRAAVPSRTSLEVNGRFARLANGRQRIARAFFFFDPLLFVADDVEQQLFIFRAGKILFAVLLVGAIVQWLAGFAVILLPRPPSDVAVEVDVGGVEPLLTRLQERVQLIHQSRNF